MTPYRRPARLGRPLATPPQPCACELCEGARVPALPLLSLWATFLAFLFGCGGGLPDADRTNLENAARLDAMAYQHADAATPLGALVRGAYCANAAVLRDQKMMVPDAGIACGPAQ